MATKTQKRIQEAYAARYRLCESDRDASQWLERSLDAAKGRMWSSDDLSALLRSFELEPLEVCTGEAHSNPFIDNCMVCAPRWGFVGKAVKVT